MSASRPSPGRNQAAVAVSFAVAARLLPGSGLEERRPGGS